MWNISRELEVTVYKMLGSYMFDGLTNMIGWCIEDLRRFSGISAISELGSRR